MIYFDSNKEAYAYEILNPLATVDDDIWMHYCEWPLGEAYDIKDGKFVQLWSVEFCEYKKYARERISELKMLLTQTDYKVQKYMEGQLTEEEWAIAKAERQAWRDEINELEKSVI